MALTDTEQNLVYSQLTSTLPNFEGAAINYKRGLAEVLRGEADQLVARELRFLQARSGYAIRNNGYAKTALKKWQTNANEIKVVWKDKKGKKHKVMQDYWDEFCLNPSIDGHGDMTTLDSVAKSSIFITGNSYIRKLIVRSGNSNKIPLKLQQIPSLLHAVEYNSSANLQGEEEIIRYGMTFVNSVPTKYHFRKSILESQDFTKPNTRITVPAEEIIHTFIREEPGQWLGIPLLSSILLSLYDLDELLDATISKQKAAQAISMIVENANNALNQLAVGSVNTSTDSAGKEKLVFNSKGGNVQYTNKGETVKWFQGGDIGANFGTLIEFELRRVAATLDLAYHELTGDVSGLNYSSLIGISIQSRNRLEYLYSTLFIPLLTKPIADYFKELAVIYNNKCVTAVPYFQLPRWRGTDDLKDAQADLLELQNGLGTYEDKLAERGLSVEDVISDREVLKQLEKYGILLTSAASSPSMNQANNTQANSNSTGN